MDSIPLYSKLINWMYVTGYHLGQQCSIFWSCGPDKWLEASLQAWLNPEWQDLTPGSLPGPVPPLSVPCWTTWPCTKPLPCLAPCPDWPPTGPCCPAWLCVTCHHPAHPHATIINHSDWPCIDMLSLSLYWLALHHPMLPCLAVGWITWLHGQDVAMS